MVTTMNFADEKAIGFVSYVDSTQVLVDIEENSMLSTIMIGNLVVINTTKPHIKNIGLIEKITRKYNNDIFSLVELEASDTEDIIERTNISSDVIKVNLIGTYMSVDGERKNIFNRSIKNFPQLDSKCYLLKDSNLQMFMNVLTAKDDGKAKLVLGRYAMDSLAEAILSGDRFFQRHSAILGSTGSGKSWCVANLLEESAKLKYSNIILFDIHGEYKTLSSGNEKIANYYKIAGPGDLGIDNDQNIYLPYWILNREELLSIFLDRSDSNAPNQSSRFTYHIRSLKEHTLDIENEQQIKKSFTVDSPIPFSLNSLLSKLKEDDEEMVPGANAGKQKKGDWNGKLTRFISRLETKVNDKRYGFMFQPLKACQSFDWLNKLIWQLVGIKDDIGIKVIDFSEVPSDVLPLVVGTISRLLFDVQMWTEESKRLPISLICDEAHLYLPTSENANVGQKQALDNFERIAKEGRKYGISILTVSQRPSDVSKTILSQCSNFIVLRLTNDTDKSVVKNLLPDTLKMVVEQLPLLDIGEAVVVGDAILLPSRIIMDKPQHRPLSATIDFWTKWQVKEPNQEDANQAVKNLRGQSKI